MTDLVPELAVFSADLPRHWLASPPGDAPISAVTDLILVTGDPLARNFDTKKYPPALMPTYPNGPAGQPREPQPIRLGRNITLSRLPRDESERIMNACSPRGHYFQPVRQFGQAYTFSRPVPEADWQQRLYAWDTDGVLSDALMMSRLVLDNGYSTEFAARVIEHADGEQQIMWLPNASQVYRLQHTRDWLTDTEAAELAALLSAYWDVQDDLPNRVRRALWNAEYGCSQRWLDLRVPLLVIAFEALANTARNSVRRQFSERVPAITAAAGFKGITPALCKELYDARSRWVHGSHIALKSTSPNEPEDEDPAVADSPIVVSIAKFQQALRAVVRRCIEDSEFAASFADEQSVRERWPVSL